MQRSDQFKSMNPIDHSLLVEVKPWDTSKIKFEIEQGELDWKWWKALPLAERLLQIESIQQELVKTKEAAALLITKEMGKPISQSRAEIEKCIDLCSYYHTHANSVLTPTTVSDTPFIYNQIQYQPLGGILGVMPWNFPFWQVFRFAIPALISGNIIWLKHAPNMNLCNKFIEQLCNIGLERKVYRATYVQVSDLETLVAHKHIQGTSLTGSEQAGSSFAALSGKHIKKTVLELGGNDACIVCEDADVNEAIKKAVFSRMLNTGQTCISTKRLYIPNTKIHEVKAYLIQALEPYVYGDVLNPETTIGVMARPDLVDRIHVQIKELEALEFEHWITIGQDKDNFVAPRVYFSNKNNTLYDNELFGPVLLVYGYDDLQDVVESVNASEFGLGAAIWSADLNRAKQIANALDVGSIAINNVVQSNVNLPFGGIKKSGFGRELGEEALLEFVNKKVVYS